MAKIIETASEINFLTKEIREALYTKVIENREKLVAAFIAETGLKPSECELVEYRNISNGVEDCVVSIRKKKINRPRVEIFINESYHYVLRISGRDDLLFEKKETIRNHIYRILTVLDSLSE